MVLYQVLDKFLIILHKFSLVSGLNPNTPKCEIATIEVSKSYHKN